MMLQTQTKLESALHRLAAICPLLFGLSLGLQWAITAILLYGPIRAKLDPTGLTLHGRALMQPERDFPLYIAGIAVCFSSMFAAAFVWQRSVQAKPPEFRTRFSLFSAGFMAFLAFAALFLYVLIVSWRLPLGNPKWRTAHSGLDVLVLLMPSVAALWCCWHDLRHYSNPPDEHSKAPLITRESRPSPVWLLDALFLAVLIVIFWIPTCYWNELSGTFYVNDFLHHWNYFSMGPAIAFANGQAFSTDFYAQYGMGWPLIFSLMSKAGVLTYSRMIGIGITYGVVYYAGLYTLLRIFFGSPSWAALGTLLALTWQMFTGQIAGQVMWQYPSSTMLRHPIDVWFFIALLMHQRTSKSVWALAAGIACGIGIFFETETGGYLAVVFGCYCLLNWQLFGFIRKLLAFAAGAFLSLAPLLWIASRGTFLHAAFWNGWIEGLQLQGFSGLGLIPIADVSDPALLFFMCFLLVYLLTIGICAMHCMQGNRQPQEIFLACVSLYGLALLLLFVGRSHPFNLYHPAVPLAVVLTGWLFMGFRNLRGYLPKSSFSSGLTAVLLVMLLTSVDFAAYPSVAAHWAGRQPLAANNLLLSPPDLAIPTERQTMIDDAAFRATIQEMRRLRESGGDVVALDFSDTLLYYASGVRPGSRYTSLFYSIDTIPQLHQRGLELLAFHPRYIVMRSPQDNHDAQPNFDDIRQHFHQLLERHYRRTKSIGDFEFWEWQG